LRKAGVDEQLAKDAARAVLAADARTDLATKVDLAELKADLITWNVGAMAVLILGDLETRDLCLVT